MMEAFRSIAQGGLFEEFVGDHRLVPNQEDLESGLAQAVEESPETWTLSHLLAFCLHHADKHGFTTENFASIRQEHLDLALNELASLDDSEIDCLQRRVLCPTG